MQNEDLARLEQLVDTLIDNYSSLKDKFHVLEERSRGTSSQYRIQRWI